MDDFLLFIQLAKSTKSTANSWPRVHPIASLCRNWL